MAYRIKWVAAVTGINPATLRAWERRYRLIAPRRSPSGYRLYSDEDVAVLSRIKRLTDEGLAIGEAIERVRRSLGTLPVAACGTSLDEVRRQLRDALVTFDRAGALAAFERLADLAPERRAEEVLLPVMREIGDLWEHGEAGVAEEHFASGFVREKLAAMLEALDAGAPGGAEAVCAGVPGELHELGLLAAAVHLASHGWRVLYLGADVPLDELRRVLAERRPALVCTSLVNALCEEEFRALGCALRGLAPAGTRLVVGGRGVPRGAEAPEGMRVAATLGDLC
ncbi:MAG TPA: MerR family transcriptional regulator, partial [Longimicrobiaceae bacterium]|nr:MerR family transcriptional regulator [Longimicrobiaceae bacterium]